MSSNSKEIIDNLISLGLIKIQDLSEKYKDKDINFILKDIANNKVLKDFSKNFMINLNGNLDKIIETIKKYKAEKEKSYDPILDKGLWYDYESKYYKRPCNPNHFYDKNGNEIMKN